MHILLIQNGEQKKTEITHNSEIINHNKLS